MDLGLSNRVAYITGGSRGIGRAIALMLAEQGVHVAICGRTQATLDATAEEIRAHGVNVWAFQADVSELEQIEAFFAAADAASNGADILVNNAVTSMSAPFEEQTDEHWRYHIDVKLMAYIRCARLALPHMRDQRFGRIVNIGGMTARIVAPLRITNGIVNAGVANFTKQFANQVAKHNITVNCVHPGMTATDRMLAMSSRRAKDAGISMDEMVEQIVTEIPLGSLIKPEDIAAAAMFFCTPLAQMITGQNIAVDGGSGESINY